MKPDLVEMLFVAVVMVVAFGLCRQPKASRDALLKIRREEKPMTVRRSRNWRWF